MFKSLTANFLQLLRGEFSMRYGRCDILIMIAPEDPQGLREYSIPDEPTMVILNIGAAAVREYEADEDGITFVCRFRGVPKTIRVLYREIGGVRDPSFTGELTDVEWINLLLTEDDIRASITPPAPDPKEYQGPKVSPLRVVK